MKTPRGLKKLVYLPVVAALLACSSMGVKAAGSIPSAEVEEDILHSDALRYRGLVDRDFTLLRSMVADELMYYRGGPIFFGLFLTGDEYVKETKLDPVFYPVVPTRSVQNIIYLYDDVALLSSRGVAGWKGQSSVAATVGEAGWRPWDIKPSPEINTRNTRIDGPFALRLWKKVDGRWKLAFYASGGDRPLSSDELEKELPDFAKGSRGSGPEKQISKIEFPASTPLDARGKEVVAIERQRLDAYVARDYQRLRDMMGDGVMFNHLGKGLLGKDAVIGALAAEKEFVPTSYEIKDPMVVQFPGKSVAALGFRLDWKVGKKTFNTFTYSLYHNDSGKWQFIGGTSGSTKTLVTLDRRNFGIAPSP